MPKRNRAIEPLQPNCRRPRGRRRPKTFPIRCRYASEPSEGAGGLRPRQPLLRPAPGLKATVFQWPGECGRSCGKSIAAPAAGGRCSIQCRGAAARAIRAPSPYNKVRQPEPVSADGFGCVLASRQFGPEELNAQQSRYRRPAAGHPRGGGHVGLFLASQGMNVLGMPVLGG